MKVDQANTGRFYRGASMDGTFRPGDRLVIAPVQLAEISPGDVVVYRGSDGCGKTADLVHRVVALVPEGLVARGDNNLRNDEGYVISANLAGRVTHFERDGRVRSVRGGYRGLLRARLLHARLQGWKWIRRAGGPVYRRLRASGVVRRWWRPSITRVRFSTNDGPLIKYVCGGRTVACWWPGERRFECRKPYDLVIAQPRNVE